jgi:hypothetical protein
VDLTHTCRLDVNLSWPLCQVLHCLSRCGAWLSLDPVALMVDKRDKTCLTARSGPASLQVPKEPGPARRPHSRCALQEPQQVRDSGPGGRHGCAGPPRSQSRPAALLPPLGPRRARSLGPRWLSASSQDSEPSCQVSLHRRVVDTALNLTIFQTSGT